MRRSHEEHTMGFLCPSLTIIEISLIGALLVLSDVYKHTENEPFPMRFNTRTGILSANTMVNGHPNAHTTTIFY